MLVMALWNGGGPGPGLRSWPGRKSTEPVRAGYTVLRTGLFVLDAKASKGIPYSGWPSRRVWGGSLALLNRKAL